MHIFCSYTTSTVHASPTGKGIFYCKAEQTARQCVNEICSYPHHSAAFPCLSVPLCSTHLPTVLSPSFDFHPLTSHKAPEAPCPPCALDGPIPHRPGLQGLVGLLTPAKIQLPYPSRPKDVQSCPLIDCKILVTSSSKHERAPEKLNIVCSSQ